MKILLSILLIFSLAGCDSEKQIASDIITDAIKSPAQRAAESMCLNAALATEGRRTPGLRAILPINDPQQAGTQVLSQNDFLVTVAYKKITLDDPGNTGNHLDSYSGAVCEVKDGGIVQGHINESLSESLASSTAYDVDEAALRYEAYGALPDEAMRRAVSDRDQAHVRATAAENARIITPTPSAAQVNSQNELKQRVVEVIHEMEVRYPELNPQSPKYNQVFVNEVLRIKENYERQGVPSDDAIRRAVWDAEQNKASMRSAAGFHKSAHFHKSAYSHPAAVDPIIVKCQYKSVMTDADNRACGVNPPGS